MYGVQFCEDFRVLGNCLQDFLCAAERVNWTLDVFVQFCVVGDKSDSDFVPLGNEECWAAPVRCFIGGKDYPFLN